MSPQEPMPESLMRDLRNQNRKFGGIFGQGIPPGLLQGTVQPVDPVEQFLVNQLMADVEKEIDRQVSLPPPATVNLVQVSPDKRTATILQQGLRKTLSRSLTPGIPKSSDGKVKFQRRDKYRRC